MSDFLISSAVGVCAIGSIAVGTKKLTSKIVALFLEAVNDLTEFKTKPKNIGKISDGAGYGAVLMVSAIALAAFKGEQPGLSLLILGGGWVATASVLTIPVVVASALKKITSSGKTEDNKVSIEPKIEKKKIKQQNNIIGSCAILTIFATTIAFMVGKAKGNNWL